MWNFTYFKQSQRQNMPCLLAELAWRRIYLTNESCYLLKHAVVHVCRQVQIRSREHPSIKSRSEIVGGLVIFLNAVTFTYFSTGGNVSSQETAIAELQLPLSQAQRGSSTIVSCIVLESRGRGGRPPAHTALASFHHSHCTKATPQSRHAMH